MQSLLTHWADALLAWLGLTSALNNGWDRWVAFSLVLLALLYIAGYGWGRRNQRIEDAEIARYAR